MKLTSSQLAHLLLRRALGVNIGVRGAVRLPKLQGFAHGLEKMFSETFLPASLVYGSAYGIAVSEAIIGALLVSGLFLRKASTAGMLLMVVLIFGTTLREDWSVLGIQMIYVGLYYLVLRDLDDARWTLDGLIEARRAA